jgi:cellulose synthase/poly-beta-1,6-N-acetylglucosamine synthase-like glycosyltransferase
MDEAVRIAFEAGLPYAGLRDFRPDADLFTAVAPAWARRERAVPLAVADGRLTLATSRPDVDLSGLDGQYAFVDLVIAPATEIDAALAALPADPAPAPAADPAPAPAADPPPEPAATAPPRRAPVTDPSSPERLGDLLVAHGVTTDAAIAEALDEQAQTGGLLGDVLLAREAVVEERLRTVLAEQLGLPVVDLAGYEPDADALALVPELLQRRLRCVPLAVDEAAVYVAVADPLDAEQLATLRDAAGGLDPRCFLAAREPVDDLLQALHAEDWAARVRAGVGARFPEESCAQPVRRAIVVTLSLGLLAAVAGLTLAPTTTAIVLVALAAAVLVLPALLALLVAAAGLRRTHAPDAAAPSRPPAGLPLTTLLLPLGGGGPGAVARAAATLAALDHPRARLEVLLLCPAHDLPGLRAARELTRRRPHRLVTVPADVPPTRAAMLTYGLLLARGARVAVLDPGDVPAPGLLRAAGDALHAGGRRGAAAQAAVAAPTGGGLAGAWIAARCAAWHELLAPGLARLGLPVPLASTGVVLDRDVLDEVAAWDPACSAEGVDLGLRLHKSGFRATTVDVAVVATAQPAWLQAHARWWRGALRAWLVQLRHPWRATRRMGLPSTAATTAIGLAAVVAPIAWLPVLALAGLGALQAVGAVPGDLLPETLVRLAGAQVLVVSAVLVLVGVVGGLRRRSAAAARGALLAPVGFTLAALGSWLGVAGLIAGLGRRPARAPDPVGALDPSGVTP